MSLLDPVDFSISQLGPCRIESPVRTTEFISDEERVLYNVFRQGIRPYIERGEELPGFEQAGPRRLIYFDPSKVKAAIISCGGLCPGINDVTRALVMCLHYRYGVRNVLGIRYGFQGLVPSYGHDVWELDPKMVAHIHTSGGSFLSSSRGEQDIGVMVDALERMNVNILFCIGGDGTLRGAHRIHEEITARLI